MPLRSAREYASDHTLVRRDGWWHLYSISGQAGLNWFYSGNEETLSWSISRDLQNLNAAEASVIHPPSARTRSMKT